MDKLRIGFDMDGVLADFCSAYREVLKHYYGIEYPKDNLDFGRPKTWYIEEGGYPEIPKRIEREAIDGYIRGLEGFWYGLDVMPNLHEINLIRELCEKHEVYFITARAHTPTLVGTYEETYAWLTSKLKLKPNTFKLYATQHKEVLCSYHKIDYYLDDKTQWFNKIRAAVPNVYLMDAPHNKNVITDNRVKKIEEYVNAVKGDEKWNQKKA